MQKVRPRSLRAWPVRVAKSAAALVVVALAVLVPGAPATADPLTSPVSGTSQQVAWTCTGTPCPWGEGGGNAALVWPASAGATVARLGYSASAPVYLPAAVANGLTVTVSSGWAELFAGGPQATTQRSLKRLQPGQSLVVAGLAAGEVLSVQSDVVFGYTLSPASTPTRSTR